MVRRDNGPAVGEAADAGPSGVDHRLDGEDHARLQLQSGTGPAVVQHLRLFVELPADAMPAELAHDGETLTLGEALDVGADVAEMRAGPNAANAAPHRLVREISQALGLDRRLADQEHAAGVAMKAVLDHRYVDIDDVAVL